MGICKRELLEVMSEVFAGGQNRKLIKEYEAKVRELHTDIGELTVEQDFFSARARALSLVNRVQIIPMYEEI